jgi:hypothetical protein
LLLFFCCSLNSRSYVNTGLGGHGSRRSSHQLPADGTTGGDDGDDGDDGL